MVTTAPPEPEAPTISRDDLMEVARHALKGHEWQARLLRGVHSMTTGYLPRYRKRQLTPDMTHQVLWGAMLRCPATCGSHWHKEGVQCPDCLRPHPPAS